MNRKNIMSTNLIIIQIAANNYKKFMVLNFSHKIHFTRKEENEGQINKTA